MYKSQSQSLHPCFQDNPNRANLTTRHRQPLPKLNTNQHKSGNNSINKYYRQQNYYKQDGFIDPQNWQSEEQQYTPNYTHHHQHYHEHPSDAIKKQSNNEIQYQKQSNKNIQTNGINKTYQISSKHYPPKVPPNNSKHFKNRKDRTDNIYLPNYPNLNKATLKILSSEQEYNNTGEDSGYDTPVDLFKDQCCISTHPNTNMHKKNSLSYQQSQYYCKGDTHPSFTDHSQDKLEVYNTQNNTSTSTGLERLQQHYNQLQQMLHAQNSNLYEHNQYLVGVIKKMQQKQSKYKESLKRYKNTISELQTQVQLYRNISNKNPTGQFNSSISILNTVDMPNINTVASKSMSELITPYRSNNILNNFAKTQNNCQILELQAVTDSPYIQQQQIPPEQKLEQLNDKFEQLMKKCQNDHQARKQCMQIAKQIKNIKEKLKTKKNMSVNQGNQQRQSLQPKSNYAR